ncbi:MAG: hypothetical protein CMI52_01090 [Parcubacteria group bacterium]|nr:hypothetical protein [Parcubacteria group bacterium]|tara:strand:- start:44 stop:388 length:345 start_codon:yes stop_codon:yes gene_type:complete
MKKQPNTALIVVAFVLIFAAIVYFWFRTTGKHVLQLVDEAKEQDNPVVDQLKEDFAEIGKQFEEDQKRFEKQKAYILKRQEEEAAAASSTLELPQEIIDAIQLELEKTTTSTQE